MRRSRSFQPGTAYHFIARFVANEWILASDLERNAYLSFLAMYLRETDWRCFSFALMSSHVHLGLVAGQKRFSGWVRPAHNEFANWLNETHERIGAVFVRGPKMLALEPVPEAAARLISYIHANPVRAGVVADPRDTNWTSHRAFLGAHRPPWLDVELGLRLSGFDDGIQLDEWMRATPTDRKTLQRFIAGARKRDEPSEDITEDFSDTVPGLSWATVPHSAIARDASA